LVEKILKSGIKFGVALFAILCIAISDSAFGQTATKSEWTFQFGAGITTSSVKSDAADKWGIGTRGFGLQISVSPLFRRIFAIRLDFGGETISDKQKFTQETTAGEISSGVTLFFGSIAAGFFIPPVRLDKKTEAVRLAVGVNVGTQWVTGERSLQTGSNTICVNCRRENLDLRGGFYFEPTIQLHISRRSVLGLSYRRYKDRSDLQDSVVLKYIYSIRSKAR